MQMTKCAFQSAGTRNAHQGGAAISSVHSTCIISMGYELGNDSELVTGMADEALMGQSRFKFLQIELEN